MKNYLECVSLASSIEPSKLHLIHCRLGHLYEQDNKLNESIVHFEKSKDIIKDDKKEDIKLVDTLHSLSRVYSKMKRYDDALQCSKDLVSLQSDASSLASVFHSMGNTYFELGQLSEAQEYLQKSMSIHKTTRDPDALSMAKTLKDLARVNKSNDDLKSANDNLVEVCTVVRD